MLKKRKPICLLFFKNTQPCSYLLNGQMDKVRPTPPHPKIKPALCTLSGDKVL